MRTRKNKLRIAEIAKQHNITYDQAEEIIESVFRFTADTMKEGNKQTLDFSHVRIIKWGVFKVKPGRREFLKRLRDEKSTRDSK